jgi:hypothetical protein
MHVCMNSGTCTKYSNIATIICYMNIFKRKIKEKSDAVPFQTGHTEAKNCYAL